MTLPAIIPDAPAFKKGQIRPTLQAAIYLLVEEGLSQDAAAKRVGMKAPSLSIALKKPHVRAYLAGVKRAWMDNQTSKAWKTVADLATGAASEDVRLKASRVFIEADEAARSKIPEGVKQQVQIIANTVNLAPVLPNEQQRGIIEAPAYQVLSPTPSNSEQVGRGYDDDE